MKLAAPTCLAFLSAPGIPFRIQPFGSGGAAVIRLRGSDRPAFSAKTEKPLKVRRKGKALVFLRAAGWVQPGRKAPCLLYDVIDEDGAAK